MASDKTGPKNRKDKTLTITGRKRKANSGRPRVMWDEAQWRQIDGMCAIQCTEGEIAGVMNVSTDTLERMVKDEWGINFAEYYKQKSDKGKMSLRRLQWKSAEAGNVAMQIFLGKQMLGQKEKAEAESVERIEVVSDVPREN